MTKPSLQHIIPMLFALALSTHVISDTSVQDPETIGRALDGEMIATFENFGRGESGLLESIPITVKNLSESTMYEFLFDRRIHQIAIQFWDNDVILNDPFENIQERMMGDTPMHLIRLEPGQSHLIDIRIDDYADSSIYKHLDAVRMLFNFTVPIYQEGTDTSKDSSLEWMRVFMSPTAVPVIEHSAPD